MDGNDYPRTVETWAAAVSLAEDAAENRTARVMMRWAEDHTLWVAGDRGDVLALAAALFAQPPADAGPLTALDALSVASACFEHEIAPGGHEPGDTDAVAALVRRSITALDRVDDTTEYDEATRTAMRRAVADLRLTETDTADRAARLPGWLPAALAEENPSWLSEYAVEQVRLVCATDGVGRRWCYISTPGTLSAVLSWTPNPDGADR